MLTHNQPHRSHSPPNTPHPPQTSAHPQPSRRHLPRGNPGPTCPDPRDTHSPHNFDAATRHDPGDAQQRGELEGAGGGQEGATRHNPRDARLRGELEGAGRGAGRGNSHNHRAARLRANSRARYTRTRHNHQDARLRGELEGAARRNSPQSPGRPVTWRVRGRMTSQLATITPTNAYVANSGRREAVAVWCWPAACPGQGRHGPGSDGWPPFHGDPANCRCPPRCSLAGLRRYEVLDGRSRHFSG